MSRLSQCQKIINYMKAHGSVTVLEIETKLHITSAHRRLADLREKGYSFNETWVEKKNAEGEKVRYKVYRLRGEPNAQ